MADGPDGPSIRGARLLVRTITHSIAEVESRVVALGAVRSASRNRVQCNYFRRNELFLLQTAESPAFHYIIMTSKDNGCTSTRIRLAGPDTAPLLKQAQANAQLLKVSVEGPVYLCGDYVVRLGQLFFNNTLSGVVVEIEYLPCCLASAAAAPLDALADRLLPAGERDFSSSETECFRDVQDLPDRFGVEHSALLLVGLMRHRFNIS